MYFIWHCSSYCEHSIVKLHVGDARRPTYWIRDVRISFQSNTNQLHVTCLEEIKGVTWLLVFNCVLFYTSVTSTRFISNVLLLGQGSEIAVHSYVMKWLNWTDHIKTALFIIRYRNEQVQLYGSEPIAIHWVQFQTPCYCWEVFEKPINAQ